MESFKCLFSNKSVIALKFQVLRKSRTKNQARVGLKLENTQF